MWTARPLSLAHCVALALALGGATGCYDGAHFKLDGAGGGAAGGAGEGGEAGPGEGQRTELLLLTQQELSNTLVDVFGVEPLDSNALQPDKTHSGFLSVGASLHSLSQLGLEKWDTVALETVDRVFDAPTEWIGCEPQQPDDACATEYIERLGKKLWRRSLTEPERSGLIETSMSAASSFAGDAVEGLRFATYSMLISPNLLYRVHNGESDPQRPGVSRLSAYELASKLSFALTRSTPDDELLEAAESGAIHEPDELRRHAERLWASTRGEDALRGFCREYFAVATLTERDPSALTAAGLSADVRIQMQAEVERLCVDGIRGGDAREIFMAEQTEVSGDLAQLYGVSAPGEQSMNALQGRAGILTSPGLLFAFAHGEHTSPTLRGQFVRSRVLCQDIPPPPPEAAFDGETAGGESLTRREKLEQHANDPACTSCHLLMDPIGYGLEYLDSIGRFRELDAGKPVDAAGDLDGAPFDDAVGLSQAVVEHPRLASCMTQQWFVFGQGRPVHDEDAELLDELSQSFAASGFDYEQLVLDIVTSESFRTLAPEEMS